MGWPSKSLYVPFANPKLSGGAASDLRVNCWQLYR